MYHMQQVVVGGVVKGVELAEVIQRDETVNTYTRQFSTSKFPSSVCVCRGVRVNVCVHACMHTCVIPLNHMVYNVSVSPLRHCWDCEGHHRDQCVCGLAFQCHISVDPLPMG